MTPNTTELSAWAVQSAPAWLHLLVIAFAVLVLVATLTRDR
ncbi:hypothetical protein WDV06_16975 [Streptomyces racemochromogenes]|uniref:Uncharacterized protein n=1 Tax=Streptomyces racemochromogenes TaxID=67353 RepID=A0ABW7PFM0_9ACTN